MRRTPSRASIALALSVAVAACGGGGGGSSTGGSSGPATAPKAGTPTSPAGPKLNGSGRGSVPRTGATTPGGAEPVRAPAALSGAGGRIGPPLLQVPPYVAVEVSLTARDGRGYRARVAGHTVSAGGAPLKLPGLRPGGSYDVRQVGGAGSVSRISASAEPGP